MAKVKRKLGEVAEKKMKKKKVAEVDPLAAGTASGGEEVPPESFEASPALSLSPEEQRVLERKLKKERRKEEKRRLREAGGRPNPRTPAPQTPAEPTPVPAGAKLALDYLCSWAQKRRDWKFQKTRQTWLLVHMYDRNKVPDEYFPTLLAYLDGLKGQARELTVQKAEAQMQALDEVEADSQDPLLLAQAQRLREVLQLLS